MRGMKCILIVGFLGLFAFSGTAFGAYYHAGDTDSDIFGAVYPETEGTKLDSCAACHTGGQYLSSTTGKWVTLGSCQWCHYAYGYDESGDIDETLNAYGKDYGDAGRSADALGDIADVDSDGDGFSNIEEIAAVRFPGDAGDDPTKVPAPYRVFTRQDLETLNAHTQFQLMNTHKSGDFYAQYTGVPVSDLLEASGILPEASGIKAYAPDGWAQFHPLDPDPDPIFYHVYGQYPQALYYYAEEADSEMNTDYGWCDYSASSCEGRNNGDLIEVDGGLKMILAYDRDGENLTAGELTVGNKLDGEGPYRIVPPQKVPGPPDQSSKSNVQDVIWPFDEDADHNAGFSTRSTTMIKVDPLPEGTTDIDTLEAGWNFVDEGKIMVYGAIDPLPTVKDKLSDIRDVIASEDLSAFKNPASRKVMTVMFAVVEKMIATGNYQGALRKLGDELQQKTNGCIDAGAPDDNDWILTCDFQKEIYWKIHEIIVLLKIVS